MTKFFKKFQRTNFGAILGLQNLGKKRIFPEKKALSVFKYPNHLPSCKYWENINDPFLRKMLNWRIDRQTYRQTGRQIDTQKIGDLIDPPQDGSPKRKKNKNSVENVKCFPTVWLTRYKINQKHQKTPKGD